MRMVKVSMSVDNEEAQAASAVEEVAHQLGISAYQVRAIAGKHVTTVVSRAFGLKVTDVDDPVFKIDPGRARQYIAHLLTANTPLPAEIGPETFHTVTDNQREVMLEVWEQAGSVASEELEDNTLIGQALLSDLPPRRAGTPFQVVFRMTETGQLKVHAKEADSGREVGVEIQIGGLDEAAMERAAAAVARYELSEVPALGMAGQDARDQVSETTLGGFAEQNQLQQLLWEREDMRRRESDEGDARRRRLEINLELLKVLASRGHVDMVNVDIDRLIDELAPTGSPEILADTPAADAEGEAEQPLSAALDDDADRQPPRPDNGRGAHSASQPRGKMTRPDQRFFLAELEDHPTLPLKKAEQYTIAFSVGLPFVGVIGAELFPDEVLAAAAKGVDVFDLTVQLDSDDFEIFGERTRPLRVPRTGRSLGKARFDITPRRNGHCRLVASVHYRGNFVHQMELAIPVGGRRKALVEVSARGRPPDSAVSLEPRSISIVLEPASTGGFSCTALGSVVGRTILPIKDTELAAAVESARAAMMSVIQSVYAGELVFQTRIDIPDEARDSALRMLARAGSRLFQRLFLHPTAGADARRIGEWLRGYALDPGLRLTVQIVADRAPLPWAMLYLGDASEGAELKWNNFLGMRHIVEQLPLQASLSTRDNEIASEPSLAVSVNVNTSIDASMGITLVAEHQKYWTDTATARAGLKLVSRSTKSEVVHALADGSTGDQVVYFYCHATAGGQDNRGLDTAAIVMGKNDPATLADLHIDAPTTVQLAGSPLVFINACESADLSPLFYDGFVPYFMAKGARGVIGTECKIPVLFAIEWADAFFEQFLDGAAVGETVLKLRRGLVREHNNPLGLIYAVHCDADTRIAPALARKKRQ